MKNFISKIKNKRLKGNISLLIIFILLASSVIALLSINQIQHLLTYWNMTFNYFRAFYIAKAWTELGLTEVYNREAWFKQTISSWDAIVYNLVWIYSWFNPYFEMNIESNFDNLTNDVRYTKECSGSNKITLGTWEWIMLSLFTDDKYVTIKDILDPDNNDISPLKDEEIRSLKLNPSNAWDFTFWIFDYDDKYNMNNIIVKPWDNLYNFIKNNFISWTRRYITIKNSWTDTVEFCVSWNWKIPYSDFLITVKANYADMEVWLQSVIKKKTPSWSLDVLWDY